MVAYKDVCLYWLQDAMQSLTSVVDAQPDAQAAFNLVLCTFALGDKEMMKQAFTSLMEVRQQVTLPSRDMV